MAFTPRLVERVRKRAHFQCCLCKAIGVEIHHIVPQAESGPDTEENAAPLCPSCHETYGANPTKRKLIREARDHWYEVCDKRYAPDQSVMKEVQSAVSATASKEDLQSLKKDLIEGLSMVITAPNQISVGTPSDSCPGATHLLSTNDLLITLFDHKSQRDDAQANLLCLEGLWPEKRERNKGRGRQIGSKRKK